MKICLFYIQSKNALLQNCFDFARQQELEGVVGKIAFIGLVSEQEIGRR